MRQLPIIIVFVLLIASVFSSCKDKEQSIDEKLSRQWTFEHITDVSGNKAKSVGENDFLTITSKNNIKSFSYDLNLEKIHATGNWSVVDSLLIFEYDPQKSHSEVDSMQFETTGTNHGLTVFHEGKELATVSNNGVIVPRVIRKYKVVELTPTVLILQENNRIYSLSYLSKAQEGSISFSSIGRGIVSVMVMLIILYVFSANRKGIQWKLVGAGLSFQLIIAIGVLKVDFIKDIFEMFGQFFVVILSFTLEGSRFVFGDMVNPSGSIGFVFAFQILPTIIFFSALTSLLFYLGILQKIVYALAWIMSKTMKLSGAESLAAAANVFLGQTEAPLMVKPYISGMTRSELLCLMTGGMATIAGGVMAAYIGFLGGDDPVQRLFFAKHLLAASVMSAPAAVVAAKMLLPQTEKIEEKLVISKEKIGKNFLEAISIGTTEGLKLAVNVGAMLLVFIALIAMLNFVLKDFIGSYTGLNESILSATGGKYDGLTMQFLLGYICAPLSWLMGVCTEDMVLVGQLLGEKTILNEFVAYTTLGKMQVADLFKEEKSIIIATYILCGFANFASIGIQIGGIGSLAPDKRTTLSELGFRALLGGTVASLLTAVMVGMLI